MYITFSWLISHFNQPTLLCTILYAKLTWFQTLAVFWKLYSIFWVIPSIWILLVDVSVHYVCSNFISSVSLQSVPNLKHIKFRQRGITQKKEYNKLHLLMSSSCMFQHTRYHPQGVQHIPVRSSGMPNGYTTQFNHLGRMQLRNKAHFPNKCWQSLDDWWLKAMVNKIFHYNVPSSNSRIIWKLYFGAKATFYLRDRTVLIYPFGMPEDQKIIWWIPWGWHLVHQNMLE
jgi:hypothetical protein